MRATVSFHRRAVSRLRIVLILGLPALLLILLTATDPHVLSPEIAQRDQFNAINAAVELFGNEYGAYPPSDANDPTGKPYGGAMKLAEALVGQDMQGWHSQSVFRRDGFDATGAGKLYPENLDALETADRRANLRIRRGPYLQAESANAFRLVDIFGKGKTGPFPEEAVVLCDIYVRRRPGGRKTGMPILYYRADANDTAHDVNNPDDPNDTYDYRDNHALVALGVPGKRRAVHPLADPKRFYINTRNDKAASLPRPHRADTYILIGAGHDGRYGTADDICNFAWRYRER